MNAPSEEPMEEDNFPADPTDVGPGQVQIHGHFIGTVSTVSHCMEVTMPLHTTVPASVVWPMVSAIAEAPTVPMGVLPGHTSPHTPDATPTSFNGHSPSNNKPPDMSHMKKIWEDLVTLIKAHAPAMAVPADPPDVAPPPDKGQSPPFRRVSSPSEEVLKMDIDAKEALLQQVMAERDALQEETESLKEQLGQGTLSRFMRKGTRMFARHSQDRGSRSNSEDSWSPRSSQDNEGDRPLRASTTGDLRRSSRSRWGKKLGTKKDEESESSSSSSSSSDDEELAEAPPQPEKIYLSGQFMGNVRTQSHLLEINLPVRGNLPVHALLEVLESLSQPPGHSGASPPDSPSKLPTSFLGSQVSPKMNAGHHHHTHRPADTSEVLGKLHKLLAVEFPEQEEHRRAHFESLLRAKIPTPPGKPEEENGASTTPVAAPEAQPAAENGPADDEGKSDLELLDFSSLETKLKELERLAMRLTRPSTPSTVRV